MSQPATIFLLYHEIALPGRELCQPAAGHEPGRMLKVALARPGRQIGLAVRQRFRFLGRDVLQQRTPLLNIEDLASVADRQHRLVRRQSVL